MDFDHIGQYILPILILLFYVFAGGRKKKPAPPQQDQYPDDADEDFDEEEEEEELYIPAPSQQKLPPPQKAASSLPPVQRTLSDFESAITSRQIATNIEKRTIISAISDARADSLISTELTERIDLDQAYAIKERYRPSRGRVLLKKSGLKQAFILQEIFKRPDVF
ncbi:MAG: hypothetical protein KF898_08190 [Parachlamydiales bacterium]|nr:hypothetical protein [Verrucomicrobiota bacterium]MBX3719612.1 hypothetical protein [Candidatus Acheromyda pituitae]